MAIQAKVRRFGHSTGKDWWSHDDQDWVDELDATPVPMAPVGGISGLHEATLIPASARGDEHTYAVEMLDTEDPSVRDVLVLNVDASPSPNAIVEWTEQGDFGPTKAVRALYESPEAAAAASPPYADADKVEAVTIDYDGDTGRRTRYSQIES